MLTQEQKNALNDILLDYWQEMGASDIITDVVQIADPIETAKYLDEAASTNEQLAADLVSGDEGKKYYLNEARKFRDVAKLLRKGG